MREEGTFRLSKTHLCAPVVRHTAVVRRHQTIAITRGPESARSSSGFELRSISRASARARAHGVSLFAATLQSAD